MRKWLVLSLFFSLSFFLESSAQTTNSATTITANTAEETTLPTIEENWTFHQDNENKVFYIDLSALGGKMSKLSFKDETGSSVFKDDLLSIPSNTIYELNLASYEKGTYTLELHTYSQLITKEVIIK